MSFKSGVKMKMNLGLLFGGRSGEHEVSLQSAKSIVNAVNRDKFNLLLLAIDKQGDWYLADESNYLINEDDPKNICLNVKSDQQIALIPNKNFNRITRLSDGKELGSLDVMFPIIHGTFGEDGSLQGFCSMLNLPCVGADVLGSSVGMDKLIGKQLLQHAGIPIASYVLVTGKTKLDDVVKETKDKLDFPVFVKPVCSGSSVGVYKVQSEKELEESIIKALKFDKQVLIEEAIEGRELECAVLGNTDLIASVPGEIIPKHAFYSYEAKYIDSKGASLELPADLSPEIAKKAQALAISAYRVLSCSGMARVDMFLTSDNKLVLNEINTLPGFTKISMYPKLMELSGIPYSELIEQLVNLALERHNQQETHLKNVLSESNY